jgi:hypothetical protein
MRNTSSISPNRHDDGGAADLHLGEEVLKARSDASVMEWVCSEISGEQLPAALTGTRMRSHGHEDARERSWPSSISAASLVAWSLK